MPRRRGGAMSALAPGCPLTFDVECLTDRRASRGATHPMTVRGDGSVESPHDMDAERVAVALGGYSSCLELVNSGIPALQEAIGLLSRRLRPPLRRRRDGRWSVPKVAQCACPGSFSSAARAAEHARSPAHIAAHHACPERLLRNALGGIELAVARLRDGDLSADRVCIREPAGITRLWAAALHPDDLVEMSARVWQVTEPLPLSYFLGMAYNAVDAAFVETAIEGRPDGDTAAWLAWLPADLRRAEECRALLGFGLPRTNVVTLMEAGIPPGQVASTADETGAPRDLVARALALWAPAGCRPKASDLRLLAEHGIPTYRPSAAAIDDLERHTADLPDAPTRTELGVMLAVGGTREAVVMGLAGGARSAVELVDKLEEQS